MTLWSCTILMFLRSLSVKAYEVLKLLIAKGELPQSKERFLAGFLAFVPSDFGFGGSLGIRGAPRAPVDFSFLTLVKLILLSFWYSCPA